MLTEKNRLFPEPETTMFQGSASSSEKFQESCQKLAGLLSERGWEIIAGAYGPMVKAASDSGATVRTHAFFERGKEMNETKEVTTTDPLDCYKAVKEIDPDNTIIEAWGYRLGKLIANSGSYAFFKPDSGTIAHLEPIITFMHKNFTKEGTFRKIALIGWNKEEIEMLKGVCSLLHKIDNEAWDAENAWLKGFDLGEEEEITEYLTNRDEKNFFKK